ncbi:MAG TPA: aldehyde dehydrogenase family protein [Acidimicrobiales bacterium]|nr:aldehyde dehydrogenase family protein [Acidimicrobiales bacterium]
MSTADGHEKIGEPVPGVRSGGAERPGDQPVQVTDPTTGSVFATVLGGGKREAQRAVDAASAALPQWAATPPARRAAALQQVASALRQEVDDLARLVTMETGKRIAEARAEVGFSADFFDWFAAAGSALAGEVCSARPGTTHYVARQPVGVVAVLTPWNFPLSIPARKLAAAMAAGCTTLFKPSDEAPVSGLRLAELIEQVVPPGVVETVVGPPDDVAAVWLADRRVRGVTFTGSTRVGALVASQVAGRFARTVLELGGASPFLVLPDADLDVAVEALTVAKFRNNGQSCIAANTAWIPTALLPEVVDRLEAACATMAVGDPLDEPTGLGPTCTPRDPARLGELVDDAKQHGARIVSGDRPGHLDGFFVPPTLCVTPDPGARVLDEEIFGPVLPVVGYDDLEDALVRINRSPYGLAGYVCGSDVEAARRVAARLDVGLVGVNTGAPNTPQVPFAPRNDSGLGVEGAAAGLEQFLIYQTVAVS